MLSLDYCLHSYGELPLEIVLHIYKYLGYTDLLAAGATCHRWRNALYQTEFIARTRVRFTKVVLSDQHSPAEDLLKCERQFRHFLFEDVTLGQVHKLMTFIGRSAQSLNLDNVDLNDKQFYGLLRLLPHLESLSVIRCLPLFMSATFLDSNSCDLAAISSHLASIRELTISQNRYLTDALLVRLTAMMPNLQLLNMSGCQISFHNAIHRRFYPNEPSAPSESVLTFKYILSVLVQQRKTLRTLDFSHTIIGHSLAALCDLSRPDENGEPGLQLQRLYLAGCRQLNAATMKEFLHTQSQLSVLDLSGTVCLNDDCMEAIVQANPLLKDLKINACGGLTNVGAAHLRHLQRLQRLDISNCDGINSGGIVEGIASEENSVLLELNVSYLTICEEAIKAIARNLHELRCLHLNHCVNGVTDEVLQLIISQLRWLRELSLESCCRLTDAALTGINLSKLELNRTSSNGDIYPPPDSFSGSLQSIKISLRSKAEEEIVRDAKRKQAMIAAYEMNLINDEDFEGHNIQALRGLRTLNLRGCNKISDVSLKYGLKHIELNKLLLSNCQQISLLGMEALVNNCPSIEMLDLSDCYNINDQGIRIITEKLQRLRSLDISGCSQLTDHSIDAIIVNCQCLQSLSIYRCRRMYTDIEDRLSGLQTLRNVYMDNINSIENAEIFRLKKRLDC
ncbi:dynein regulatory complex subunit 6 [Drosophila albomicans]|uniref:Dynein regulatory complex subunit 6 n=1 Tax=Drosophila albomicans TaxID=7291 RepID=A0A6P8X1E8_DROAB|nr:dynein regulatory complex subunit 6 [Drosophila albomicans]XP_051859861.1 dynein regulatory complex subunit 6 [Drosophila albomicans]